MKTICPYCEAKREVETVEKIEKVNVRGENIEVLAHPYLCLTCGEYFEDPKTGFNFLDKAYEEYRRRHGLIHPNR
jgi:YgiT-type zinc finger domain-containing protein